MPSVLLPGILTTLNCLQRNTRVWEEMRIRGESQLFTLNTWET